MVCQVDLWICIRWTQCRLCVVRLEIFHHYQHRLAIFGIYAVGKQHESSNEAPAWEADTMMQSGNRKSAKINAGHAVTCLIQKSRFTDIMCLYCSKLLLVVCRMYAACHAWGLRSENRHKRIAIAHNWQEILPAAKLRCISAVDSCHSGNFARYVGFFHWMRIRVKWFCKSNDLGLQTGPIACVKWLDCESHVKRPISREHWLDGDWTGSCARQRHTDNANRPKKAQSDRPI